jgi:deoxycytidylate deaminase
MDLTGASLFSTHFPDINDLKLIVAVGISKLYFFGGTTDHSAVELINNLAGASIPLEIIHLE